MRANSLTADHPLIILWRQRVPSVLPRIPHLPVRCPLIGYDCERGNLCRYAFRPGSRDIDGRCTTKAAVLLARARAHRSGSSQ